MTDQRPNPDRFHVRFDAQIKGPIETIPWQKPPREPPHWNHRPAVIAAIVFIIAVLITIVWVLATVHQHTGH